MTFQFPWLCSMYILRKVYFYVIDGSIEYVVYYYNKINVNKTNNNSFFLEIYFRNILHSTCCLFFTSEIGILIIGTNIQNNIIQYIIIQFLLR